MLAAKRICLVGGSGYVGTAVAKRALQLGAKVSCVSRRGAPEHKQPWQNNIDYIKGDASKPSTFAEHLEKTDVVIHTVGTLIDTTITKGSKPGDPGSYELMNRDCAIKVADLLDSFGTSKKMVYLSASGHPPFIPRYITTKEEAENHIFSRKNLKGAALKPGFIYSFQQRWWSLPLKYNIDAWNTVHGHLSKVVPNSGVTNKFFQEFYVERAVLLNDVVDASLYCASHQDTDGMRLFNKDIEHYSAKLSSENIQK